MASVGVADDGSGASVVKLTGSNVQSSPAALQNLVNAVAGTTQFFAGINDLDPKKRDRVVGFVNTGNQDASVYLYPYLYSVGSANSNVSVGPITCKANGGVVYVSNGQLSEVGAPWDSISVGVNYAVLPTNGPGKGVCVTISESM